MESFFSFVKNNENMMCIFGDYRWHANILLWNIVRVSWEIAPMIESLKNLHFAMVIGFGSINIFLQSVDLIARKHSKLVLGFSLILRLHAEDILLTKYWETSTEIRSVVMFSTWIGDSSIHKGIHQATNNLDWSHI